MTSRARTGHPRLALVFGALGAVLFFAVVAARELADFDMAWHLAWGRTLWATRAVPRVDDFAYTHTAVRYVGILADLVLFGVHAAGGALALQLFGAAMGLAIAGTLYLTSVASSAAPAAGAGSRDTRPFAIAVITFAMVAMSLWLLVRPATMSFVFFAVELMILDKHRHDPLAPGSRRALATLPALMCVWANCHGAGTLGLVVLVAYVAHGVVARATRGWRSRARICGELFADTDGDDVARCAAVTALALAGAALNPWGVEYFLGASRVMAYGDLVTEWATSSAGFFLRDAPAAGAFFVFAAGVLAMGKDPATGRRAPRLWDIGLALLAAALATRVRFIPFAVIALTPLVARRAAGAVATTSLLERVLPATALLAAPCLLVVDSTSLGVGFERRHFPEPAVRFIEESAPKGRMWNFPPFGGYLVWRLYPRYRVLMDGRIGFVHEPDMIARVHASDRDPAAWGALARDLDLEWAVCRAREGEATCVPVANSPDWAMVFWDDVSAVYVRRSGPNAELAARGYRTLRHLTPPADVLAAAVRSRTGGQNLTHDAALALAQDPSSARALFLDACAGVAARDEARMRRALERLAAASPGSPAIAAVIQAWGAGP